MQKKHHLYQHIVVTWVIVAVRLIGSLYVMDYMVDSMHFVVDT